jgi:long-chain acyl-CoA synthetase
VSLTSTSSPPDTAVGVLSGPRASCGGAEYASELDRAGVRPGDRVLLCAGNSTDFPATVLGLMAADASIVLLDDRYRPHDRRRIASTTGARWIVTDPPPGAGTVPLGVPAGEPAMLRPGGARRSGSPGRLLTTDDLAPWRRRRDGLIQFSSGSTDTPKGIVKSGRAFLDNLARTAEHLGYRETDVLLPLLPFTHQYGLSIVVLGWLAGAALAVTPYRRLGESLSLAREWGATVIDATPYTYRAMIDLDIRHPNLLAELDRVRLFCTGGSPLDEFSSRAFAARSGRPLLDGYGSTEAGNISFATPDRPAACGPVLRGTEVQILDRRGRPVPPGEIGEIVVRAPDLMEGYLLDGTLVELTPPGLLRTGDVGRFGPDGALRVLGRSGAVDRLGHTLYPDAIAEKAGRCGRTVAVLPVPDARRGHSLVFVVEDPAQGDGPSWRRRMAPLLDPHEQPNSVVVVPVMPLTGSGKVDLGRLGGLVEGTIEVNTDVC